MSSATAASKKNRPTPKAPQNRRKNPREQALATLENDAYELGMKMLPTHPASEIVETVLHPYGSAVSLLAAGRDADA